MNNVIVKTFFASTLALAVLGCTEDPSAITPQAEVPTSYAQLDAAFTEYQVVTLPTTTFAEQAAAGVERGFTLELGVPGKPNWTFATESYDMYGDEYREFESGPDGSWIEIPADQQDRGYTYLGEGTTDQTHGIFHIFHDEISGEIYEADKQYGLDPLHHYVPGAQPNTYVVYEMQADIAGNQFKCGVEDQPNSAGNNDDEPTVSTRMATCKEMSIMFMVDYDLYNAQGRNTTTSRRWARNRVGNGSYRYYRYNNFPLHFRLYNSYVNRSSRNDVPTSSNQSTYLRNWNDYAWDTGNGLTLRDANLLFTDHEANNHLGNAYADFMCINNNSGQPESFAFIAKINGASNSILSKVTGHEVGHMIGADHVTYNGFMKTGFHSYRTMGNTTRNEINSWMQSNSTRCLFETECRNFRG